MSRRWVKRMMTVADLIVIQTEGFSISKKGDPNGKVEFFTWSDVKKITVFKRDLFSYDLICANIVLNKREEEIELDEEDPVWNDFFDELEHACSNARKMKDWFPEVSQPPFKLNPLIVYES